MIAVALDTMLFEAQEDIHRIQISASKTDVAMDHMAKTKGLGQFGVEDRRKHAASTVTAASDDLDGERSLDVAVTQATMVESLIYLLSALPANTLSGLHGVVVMPGKHGMRFLPFDNDADYVDTVSKLRDAYSVV